MMTAISELLLESFLQLELAFATQSPPVLHGTPKPVTVTKITKRVTITARSIN